MSNALEKQHDKASVTTLKGSKDPGGFVFAVTVLFLLLALVATGCTTRPQYIVHRAVCPVPPTLPVVMETELEALSDGAYWRLVERELALKAYIDQLEINCNKVRK